MNGMIPFIQKFSYRSFFIRILSDYFQNSFRKCSLPAGGDKHFNEMNQQMETLSFSSKNSTIGENYAIIKSSYEQEEENVIN